MLPQFVYVAYGLREKENTLDSIKAYFCFTCLAHLCSFTSRMFWWKASLSRHARFCTCRSYESA